MSKSTITTIVISLVIFILSMMMLSAMVYQVDDQGKKLLSQVATLEAERAQESSYFRLRRQTEETQLDRELLQGYYLQRESDIIDFLNSVESLASDTGVSLRTESLTTLTDANDEKWIEVPFEFSASRERVQNFVKILETLPYVLRLNSVEIEAISSVEWKSKVTLQVRVSSHDE